jgi:uncharacterized protein (TIRG00374 family)
VLGRIEIITLQESPSKEELSASRDWRRIIPGLIISAISLVVVFYFADFQQMISAVRQADYRFVLIAFVVSLGWLAVRGMVWRTLLQEKATFSQTFFTIAEGYLLNNVLPFRLGEVARAFLLGRKANLDFWMVLSSILIERSLDLAMAAGLLLSTLPLVVGASWASEAAIGVGGIVLAGLFVLYLLARNRVWALNLFERLAQRWTLLQKFGGKRLDAFFNGLAALTDGARFIRTIAWVLLNWAVALGQYYLLLHAFFPNPRFLWAAFGLGVGAMGIAAPSSPGALGVLELSLVGALVLFDLNPSVALAFALTTHLFNYVSNGILGAFALARDGESLTSLYHSLRRIG